MRIDELAGTFSKIEDTASRNEKTGLLAELLKSASDEELEGVMYLSLGRLGPLYDNPEVGLAEKMVIRALSWGLNCKEDEVRSEFKKKGDLGLVAEVFKKEERESKLTVREVYEELKRIAKDEGTGSQERKIRGVGKLVGQLDKLSARYVVRIVLSKMRLGFSDVTILDALSMSKVRDKSERKKLEQAYNVVADIVRVAKIYRSEGLEGIKKVDVTPGVPIRVAKAERVGTIEEILAKLGEVAIEPKLDGMRVQIHAYRASDEEEEKSLEQGLFEREKNGVMVKVFSRSLEDVTHMFPDLVEAAGKLVRNKGKDFVMDAEAIGYDPETGKFLPFQETIKRKRKYNVREMVSEIPLRVFVFDMLYLDGEGLLRESYEKRRERLAEVLDAEEKFEKEGGGGERPDLVRAKIEVVKEAEKARKIFEAYVGEGLEGVMFKKLDSTYQAGARNFNWVKFKAAEEGALRDTLDCVVMGYYAGRGKRQQFGLGAFLVGVKGKDEKIETVSKIGTGLTDEQWKEMYSRIEKVEVEEVNDRYVVDKSLEPDGWVAPQIVVEIVADEITKSPVHSSGYALRFPRLVRFRDDKRVEDMTSREEVERLFKVQRSG